MKKQQLYSMSLGLMGLLFLSVQPLRADSNIVANGGFEEWEKAKDDNPRKGNAFQVASLEDNWIATGFDFISEMAGFPPKVTISRDNKEKHSGHYSVLIRSEDALQNGSIATKELKLEPSSKYKLSVWYKTADLAGTGVGLWINQGPKDNFWEMCKKSFLIMGPSPEWKLYKTTFDTLPDSDNSIFFLQLQQTGGKVWFDDFSIVKVGKASDPVQNF